MRPKGTKQFLKRGLGMALSMAVAFTMLPPVSVTRRRMVRTKIPLYRQRHRLKQAV